MLRKSPTTKRDKEDGQAEKDATAAMSPMQGNTPHTIERCDGSSESCLAIPFNRIPVHHVLFSFQQFKCVLYNVYAVGRAAYDRNRGHIHTRCPYAQASEKEVAKSTSSANGNKNTNPMERQRD